MVDTLRRAVQCKSGAGARYVVDVGDQCGYCLAGMDTASGRARGRGGRRIDLPNSTHGSSRVAIL